MAEGAGSLLSSRTCDSGFRFAFVVRSGYAGLQTHLHDPGGRLLDARGNARSLPRQVKFFGSARGIYNRGNGG
jgi:hypothetical protein